MPEPYDVVAGQSGVPILDGLVVRAGAGLVELVRREAASGGYAMAALAVLAVLTEEPTGRGLGHRDLAAAVGVSPASLTPVVDALERAGEVSRTRDPHDRRVVRVAVTERGASRTPAALARVARARARLPRPTRSQEIAVRRYLRAVLELLEAEASEAAEAEVAGSAERGRGTLGDGGPGPRNVRDESRNSAG